MDNISSLDGVFKVFQLTGIQFFSLKTVLTEPKAKSVREKIFTAFHVVLVWIICLVSLVFQTHTNYHHYTDSLEQNSLNFFMKFVTIFNCFAVVYINLIASWAKNNEFVKFFKDAEKIAKLCLREFNTRLNYTKLKKILLTIMACYLVFCLCCVLTVIKSFNSSSFRALLIALPNMIINIIYFKFNFHVQILNFHLKALRDIMEREFQHQPEYCRDEVIGFGSQEARKVFVYRKIFSLTKNMADQINSSMGVVLLLIFVLPVISVTRNGYKLIMIFSGHSDESFGGKLSLLDLF
jgi:7tm Chemosensory receptor